MKLVITGGSGFIGKSVLKVLIACGHNVLCLTRSWPVSALDEVNYHVCDIVEPDTFLEKVKMFEPDAFVYLAWHGIPEFTLINSLININIAISFFETIIANTCCSKIIVAGSNKEYGNEIGDLREDQICTVIDNFSWAKHTLRQWLEFRCAKANIDLTWLRIFFSYGPNQRNAALLPTLFSSLINGKLPKIRSLYNKDDYIFVGDVARAFGNVLNTTKSAGIYNIGCSKSVYVWEVCKIAEYLMLSSNLLTDELLSSSTHQSTTDSWANINKAKSVLDWVPRVSLVDGIAMTLESYLAGSSSIKKVSP